MSYKSLAVHNAACNWIFRKFQDCEKEVTRFVKSCRSSSIICTSHNSVLAASVWEVLWILRTNSKRNEQMHKRASKLFLILIRIALIINFIHCYREKLIGTKTHNLDTED